MQFGGRYRFMRQGCLALLGFTLCAQQAVAGAAAAAAARGSALSATRRHGLQRLGAHALKLKFEAPRLAAVGEPGGLGALPVEGGELALVQGGAVDRLRLQLQPRWHAMGHGVAGVGIGPP